MMESKEAGLILLPPPKEEDVMYEKKLRLLSKRGLSSLAIDVKKVPGQEFTDQEFIDVCLARLLETGRILQLDETEWYFVEDGDIGPFSPRNEIEALRVLEAIVRGLLTSVDTEEPPFVGLLSNIHKLLLSRLDASDSSPLRKEGVDKADANLSSWALDNGIKSLIEPAYFEGMGRGAAASTNMEIGDLILEIPEDMIISEHMALNSDMYVRSKKGGYKNNFVYFIGTDLAHNGMDVSQGIAFKETVGLSGETMVLLWSMKERYNKKSKFAPFFASLPEVFQTGVGFGIAGLKALEGTLVVEEILHAKEHIRTQYDSLMPDLSDKFPELFPEKYFRWEHFLWTCQLWYSCGMKVKFSSGAVETCLVPMANLLNHSIFPHVTHFSQIEKSTNTLQLFVLRQCKVGQQCFLSYGALQNSDLLTFYGFLIDNNPYDVIPIELDVPAICHPEQSALIEKYHVMFPHWVRGFHTVPTRLMAALRVACMEEEDFISYSVDPRIQMISTKNEQAALECLLSVINSLLAPLQMSEVFWTKTGRVENITPWDVLLADSYKQNQRQALELVRSFCVTSLNSL